jgi:oligopeptide transport system ATP-binding protein
MALISVENLTRHFRKPRTGLFGPRDVLKAVDGVSFELRAGETLGVVGESGCGKSTLGRLILGMDQSSSGKVLVDGQTASRPGSPAWRAQRRDMQMVFQDAYGALNPRRMLGEQIREPLDIHEIGDPSARATKVADIMDAVKLPASVASRFPHEISGGQQQRVVIARALIMSPRLIVCDEAVASLDVSIQAQIVNLLIDLQAERQLTYLFISHDMKVVRHISTRVAIMYLGRIVEIGPRDAIFGMPQHPYTQALMSAIPNPDPATRRPRILLKGDPPSPVNLPSGCRFRTRCRFATALCAAEEPELRPMPGGSSVACHHAGSLSG